MPEGLSSIDDVLTVTRHRGRAAPREGPAAVLLEAPHGATEPEHFARVAGSLVGPMPEGLEAFFHVNTDVGSAELAGAVAERLVRLRPEAEVVVVRGLVPRTFVDLNRVIDGEGSAPHAGMTPGLHAYVKDPRDVALLLARYRAYRACVERAYGEVCGAGGLGVMVHTYAPRSVDVVVDERIVERLREAYRSERVGAWPLRPEVDLITRTPAGERLADDGLVAAVMAALRKAGVAATEDQTYPLHPATLGALLAARHRGRTLTFEVRRDLLLDAFVPFVPLVPNPARVKRMADALAEGLATAGLGAERTRPAR
jgi:hypothetical protein